MSFLSDISHMGRAFYRWILFFSMLSMQQHVRLMGIWLLKMCIRDRLYIALDILKRLFLGVADSIIVYLPKRIIMFEDFQDLSGDWRGNQFFIYGSAGPGFYHSSSVGCNGIAYARKMEQFAWYAAQRPPGSRKNYDSLGNCFS